MPAGVSGETGWGTVGAAAPTGRLSPLVRAAAIGYALAGAILTVVAFVLAPWGLLLLLLTIVAFFIAAVLRSMAAGLETIEEDES